jgi:hypothetical protein
MCRVDGPDDPFGSWDEAPPSEPFDLNSFFDAPPLAVEGLADDAEPAARPSGSRSGTVTHRRNIATTREIVLHEGPRMRVVAKATLIYRSDRTPRSVSLEIERQSRARLVDEWIHDAPRVRIEGDEVEQLFSYIGEQRAALPQLRDVEYLFMPIRGGADSIDTAGLAKLVLRVSEDPRFFRPLADLLGSNGLRALRAAVNLGRFDQGRAELQTKVDADVVEAEMQGWFERNPWVFGTEYVRLQRMRNISATSQIDLLFRSIDGYADVFELKRAGVPVLVRAPGRNHLQPSADLNAAFAQAVRYLAEARDLQLYNSARRDINLYQPRVRLVIGRSHDWDDEHVRALRDITSEWHNIDVFTYDMVIARMDLLIATMARELRPTEPPEDV